MSLNYLPGQLALMWGAWATWLATEKRIMPQKGIKGTNAFDVEAHQIAAYRAF
jgi:hypothetical protein